MATSIQLRACGGLAPFEWSKTGDVTLSSTTGTRITVSAEEACAAFELSFCAQELPTCTTGECEDFKTLCGVPNIQVSWALAGDSGPCSIGGSYPNFTLDCEPLCSGTLSVVNNGSCDGDGCSASDLEVGINLECGEHTVGITNDDFIVGENSYTLQSGSVEGATVTVTDAAGMSVTYEI